MKFDLDATGATSILKIIHSVAVVARMGEEWVTVGVDHFITAE